MIIMWCILDRFIMHSARRNVQHPRSQRRKQQRLKERERAGSGNGWMCNELYALTDSVFTSILLLFNNPQTKYKMHYLQRLCFFPFNEKPQSHHHPKPNIRPKANVKCDDGRKMKKIITFIATRKWNDTLVRYVFNKTCCIIHLCTVYSL